MLVAPREINIGGVYLPSLVIAGCCGLGLTCLVVRLLNRFRLSRYFAAPQLVFVCLVVIISDLVENLFF